MNWNDFNTIIDVRLLNELHGADDDWDDFEAVNDPASGKKLPNEGHAASAWRCEQHAARSKDQLTQPIYVTETFVKNIADIYGNFSANDDEFPTMGITIQGAPIFVECLRIPDAAVVCRRSTDEVIGDYPALSALWEHTLRRHGGKCRKSSVHIHPMNLPSLSGTDVRNFDALRQNADDPSTYPTGLPYPVILVNLNSQRRLDLLGFWVVNRKAYNVDVEPVPNDSLIVLKAWRNAQPLPFFSEEGNIARRINRLISKDWEVELGVNAQTGAKAMKAQRADGCRVLIRFDSETPLGLTTGGSAPRNFCFEEYFDWTRMLNDLAQSQESCASTETRSEAAGQPHPDRTQPSSGDVDQMKPVTNQIGASISLTR